MFTADMKGARLEFVVREISGQIEHTKTSYDPKKKKLIHTKTKQPGGYMVYLPNGHSYRLSPEQLIKRGFDRQPTVMNLDDVKDSKSAAGQFKYAITEQARAKAWLLLEEEVIKNCTRRYGKVEKETIDGIRAA